MDLIQILSSLYFALVGAYLSVVLTRLLIQNGTAIRELGEKMSQQHQDMVQQQTQQHQDMIQQQAQQHRYTIEVIKEMRHDTVEAIKEMQKTAKEIHQDTIELLKKGFGDLSRNISEIKS